MSDILGFRSYTLHNENIVFFTFICVEMLF